MKTARVVYRPRTVRQAIQWCSIMASWCVAPGYTPYPLDELRRRVGGVRVLVEQTLDVCDHGLPPVRNASMRALMDASLVRQAIAFAEAEALLRTGWLPG